MSSLTVLIVFPCLIALGIWQLHRAEEKNNMQRAFDRQEALPVAELATLDETIPLHRHVRVQGRFLAGHNLLLDNKVVAGKVGYEVVSPFILNDNAIVLVNRGWVPLGKTRADLPDVLDPEDLVWVSGRIRQFPDVGYRFKGIEYADDEWPRVVQYVDQKKMRAWFGSKILPFVIQLNADAPHGFVRQWKFITTRPEKHTAYAIQWFAIAIVLLLGYFKFSFYKEE